VRAVRGGAVAAGVAGGSRRACGAVEAELVGGGSLQSTLNS
jgi:hypothetical protein